MCSISLETIDENQLYLKCLECKTSFKQDEIEKWLEQKDLCPNCRAQWPESNNTIYVNIPKTTEVLKTAKVIRENDEMTKNIKLT